MLWFLFLISHHGKELCGVFGCTNTQEKGVRFQMLLGLRTRYKWKGPSVVCSNFISLKIIIKTRLKPSIM